MYRFRTTRRWRSGRPVDKFYGDGGYDKWKVYGALATGDTTPIIPPQHNAKINKHGNRGDTPLPRDEAIRAIRRVGRKRWNQGTGYHRRSLAETAVYRFKCCLGRVLKNRLLENQKTEARLHCKILNRFTHLGLPQFEWN